MDLLTCSREKKSSLPLREKSCKYIIETIENEGVLGKEESSLVQSALEFDETPAEKIAVSARGYGMRGCG